MVAAGDVEVNEYDGLHRRTVRDDTGGSAALTHFYWNESWQCLEERTGTSSTAHKQYVWHLYYIDALVAGYDSSGDKHFFTQDANFNVTAAIDDTGTVVERYQYSPYGEVTYLEADFDVAATQESTIGNEFLYTGRRLDLETGLQYSRHRYYHPQLGRWVNRDPIGYAGGMNLYGYVGGMPTGFVDPYDLETEGLFSRRRGQGFGDPNKFLDNIERRGGRLRAGFSPRNINDEELEDLTEGIRITFSIASLGLTDAVEAITGEQLIATAQRDLTAAKGRWPVLASYSRLCRLTSCLRLRDFLG